MRKYKKAFKIACALLNGDILNGYDSDRIFSEMMEKDDAVSANSYEEFILNNLDRLDGDISEDKNIDESDAEFMCRVMSKTVNKSTDDRKFIGRC